MYTSTIMTDNHSEGLPFSAGHIQHVKRERKKYRKKEKGEGGRGGIKQEEESLIIEEEEKSTVWGRQVRRKHGPRQCPFHGNSTPLFPAFDCFYVTKTFNVQEADISRSCKKQRCLLGHQLMKVKLRNNM